MQIAGLDLNQKNWDDFDHARWRVKFLRHLVQLHQTSPKRGTVAWGKEDEAFTSRLAAAEKELERFPEGWHTLPQSMIPRR